MLYTDYGLPQILDREEVCFKPPKYEKVKLLITFIKNSTLMKWIMFSQFKANFTVGKDFSFQLYLVPFFDILLLWKLCSFPMKTLGLL